MKIVHVSTSERDGGAAIAASRLHCALRALGQDSVFLVRDRTPGDPVEHVISLNELECAALGDPALDRVTYAAYQQYRTPGADRLFSTDLPTRNFSCLGLVREADVINVHWTAGMMSVPAVRLVQDLGKPVVWTLHDQRVFTGGCHYSNSCRQYEHDCSGCPGLIHEAQHIPPLLLRHKQQWLDTSRLTVVCPSSWLANCARNSTLLRGAIVETIPYGLPVSRYQTPSRLDARMRLGLPADATILLAGAHRLDEARKGHDHLREALALLAQDPQLRERFAAGQLVCAAFGHGDLTGEIPIRHLGRLVGDEQMALAYRAADLFVLPTLEDNLPNTLLESIAAGTPVIAYATGGVPDVLQHGRCGIVVSRGNVGELATAIRSLLDAPAERQRLSEQCESHARAFDSSVQAGAYLQLYRRILDSSAAHRTHERASLIAAPDGESLRAAESRLLERVLASPMLTERLVRDWTTELRVIHDGWRVTRETLHQAEGHLTKLTAARGQENAELETQLEGLRTAVASLASDNARLAAERAALKKRVTRSMTKVVILGAADRARLIWEALMLAGSADVVAFVDSDPRRHGRPFLGSTVQPVPWLSAARWDVVVASAADLSGTAARSALAGVAGDRILALPDDQRPEVLARFVASRLPDPLLTALNALPARTGLRVGIFGTGSAAMKVWEALADIDEADAVWFADNNQDQHGRALLWLEVIAPERIPAYRCDAVIIGSMSRDAICQQLRKLGVPHERILMPDVAGSVDRIREQITEALRQHVFKEVA
ncbi:MAG TPA: glycosyltransferase [Vicinamibacterales bacterium]|nr:glycosyltransferase [Vicinamibacterales bacterium]